MQRIIIFLSILWRNDPQYEFIGWSLAWELSGILTDFDFSEWERF